MKNGQTAPQTPRPAPMAELYSLAGIVEERRNLRWEESLLQNAWHAVFLVPGLDTEQAICSLGGFPYLRLAMPRAGLAYTGYSLRSVALHCLEKGLGAAIYMTEADGISDSMARISMGDLDMLYRENGIFAAAVYTDNADVIRSYTARALQRQIKAHFPAASPKVRISVSDDKAVDVALSLGMDIGGMTTETTEPIFSSLEWCLPRGVRYRLLDITAENDQTVPLAEFF